MKKTIWLILLTGLIIMGMCSVYGDEGYTVDMVELSTSAVEGTDYSLVKFGTGSAGADYYWAKFQWGSPNFLNLGTFDLNGIVKIRFDYSNASESTFGDDAKIIFSEDQEATKIIGTVKVESGIGWGTPEEAVIENLNTTYNGPVYLSVDFGGSNDGVLVANIEFQKEAVVTPTPDKTESATSTPTPTATAKSSVTKTPVVNNPDNDDEGSNTTIIISIVAGVIIVAGAAAAAIIISKRRKA